MRQKTKMLYVGQPCRDCGTPVEKIEHEKNFIPSKNYYYSWWLWCPDCKKTYTIESQKIIVGSETSIPKQKSHFGNTRNGNVFSSGMVTRTVGSGKEYEKYLKSDAWKKKSEAKKKENPRCSLCNRRSSVLHVHHRTYIRCGNENELDLTVLCDDCHSLFHKNYEYDNKVGCHVPKNSKAMKKKNRKGVYGRGKLA